MPGMLIGYARVSTFDQDLTAQREQLLALGVALERIYVDHGLTGRNRARPGLREALAAVREGDTFVVTKLDRLGRSLPDLRDIIQELNDGGVAVQISTSVYDPNDPVAKLLINVLGMVAEFEADLTRLRTREGLAVAKSRGRLQGKKPKLMPAAERAMLEMVDKGEQSIGEIAQVFGVARSTVYRAIDRANVAAFEFVEQQLTKAG